MKILLLGKNGQIGWELQRALAPLGEVLACGRDHADFEKPEALRALVREAAPDVLVNAAAYTAVDQAESEPERAMQVNAAAVAVLAGEMKRRNGWLVHYSTDYVFDGGKAGYYTESDWPAPQSAYGRSKLAGENIIVDSGCPHLIFRTSWVYAARGGNFARTMLRLAQERDEIKVVADQIGAPTGAELIADISALVLHRVLSGDRQPSHAGIYHLAAAGETSWYAYAALVLAEAHRLGAKLRVHGDRLIAIPAEQYQTAARRPANSRLDTAKLCDNFQLRMPSWEAGVKRVFAEWHQTGQL